MVTYTEDINSDEKYYVGLPLIKHEESYDKK